MEPDLRQHQKSRMEYQHHKKCTGVKEAKKYLVKGGIPDAEINQHMEKVKEIQKTRTRKLRKKSRVNYREMSGEKTPRRQKKLKQKKMIH